MSTFLTIAEPLAKMGIPITPVRPGTKRAFLPDFPTTATTDLDQIYLWDKQYPDHSAACVARAEEGGVWFFETDSPEVAERVKAEIGQDLNAINTFKVRSRPGRGHYYFKHNAESLAKLSNISQTYVIGQDWSVRTHHQYVVAPGSLHPDTGKPYQALNNNPILEAPSWLIDWMLTQKTTGKPDVGEVGEKEAPTNERGLIPHGSIHGWMLSEAGKMRDIGLQRDEIEVALLRRVHENCEPPIDDDKVRQMAKSICQYEPTRDTEVVIEMPQEAPPISDWRSQFRSVGEMDDGPVDIIINGVLQEGTCFIGASASDGKTLMGLAWAKAISTGTPLFGLEQYGVEKPRAVIYLIPETRDRAFRKRCEAFQIPDDETKFLARTISSGKPMFLDDPYLLEAVRVLHPVVFLDTAVRFMRGGDENSSAENRQLVNDVISLQAAGAVAVSSRSPLHQGLIE